MAGTVMPAPKFIGLDNNANPVSGGKLYTYVAGTTTPQATYSDVNLTVANANPVVLDSAGRATVFLSGSSYKFVLKDSDDVTIWTQDNVQAVAPFSTNLDIEGIAGETILAGQVCYLSDGSGALTAGRWYLADADNAYSSSRPQIAIAPDAIATGESGTFRLQGAATKSNAQADFVVGSTYYVSATAGQLSLTPGTNQRVVGQADSTTTLVISPNPPNVAVTPTFTDGITVVSTDAGASAGPYLDLYRESASPAASDQIGEVRFSGEDSAGNKQLYARMYGQIADPTSTTEDGQLRFATIRNGVETLALVLDENGNLLPDGASQTMGSATKPWLTYHIGSGGSLNFANSDCTITHSSNALAFAGGSYTFNSNASAAVAFFNQATTGKTGLYLQENGTNVGAFAQLGLIAGTSDRNIAIFAETGFDFNVCTNGSPTVKLKLTTGGNLALGATARLYLDGVAATGDTYIEENSANNVRIVAGGQLAAQFKTDVVELYGAGSQYKFDSGACYPANDNARNLGGTSNRWAAVYAANGTIQTSDRTRKRDISDETLGLDFVLRLKPVSFVMNDEADAVRRHGLIAQEVIEAAQGASLAGILSGTHDGEYGLNYAGFVPALIRAVHEQQAEINALKARIH